MGAHVDSTSSPDTELPESESILHMVKGYIDLKEKMTVIKQFASDHPVITLFLIITIVMCSVPFFCFFAFVFTATVLGFTGFVMFEGVILTVSCLVLGGVLFLMGLLSVGLTTFLVLSYFAFRFAQSMLLKFSERFPMPAFLTREPTTLSAKLDK